MRNAEGEQGAMRMRYACRRGARSKGRGTTRGHPNSDAHEYSRGRGRPVGAATAMRYAVATPLSLPPPNQASAFYLHPPLHCTSIGYRP
jgi:hypothetical protein